MNKKDSVTYKAVKGLGGQVKTGDLIGVTQQSVCVWVKSNRLPAEHVLKVEAALSEKGLDIDRHDLRPDVFGVRPALFQSARSASNITV